MFVLDPAKHRLAEKSDLARRGRHRVIVTDLLQPDIHDSHDPVDLVYMNRNEDELLGEDVDLCLLQLTFF